MKNFGFELKLDAFSEKLSVLDACVSNGCTHPQGTMRARALIETTMDSAIWCPNLAAMPDFSLLYHILTIDTSTVSMLPRWGLTEWDPEWEDYVRVADKNSSLKEAHDAGWRKLVSANAQAIMESFERMNEENSSSTFVSPDDSIMYYVKAEQYYQRSIPADLLGMLYGKVGGDVFKVPSRLLRRGIFSSGDAHMKRWLSVQNHEEGAPVWVCCNWGVEEPVAVKESDTPEMVETMVTLAESLSLVEAARAACTI